MRIRGYISPQEVGRAAGGAAAVAHSDVVGPRTEPGLSAGQLLAAKHKNCTDLELDLGLGVRNRFWRIPRERSAGKWK